MLQEIDRPTKRCHATGRALLDGEPYFTALVRTQDGLARRDFCTEAWTGPPEGTVGHWKGRLPEADAPPSKPREVPVEAMLDMFELLGNGSGENPDRVIRLRYVLALSLVRRRALKLHSIRRDDAGEVVIVRKPTDQNLIEIADPGLSESQTEAVEAELRDWMETIQNAGLA